MFFFLLFFCVTVKGLGKQCNRTNKHKCNVMCSVKNDIDISLGISRNKVT